MSANYLQLLRFYPRLGSQHDCRCSSGQTWDKPAFRLLTPVDRIPGVSLKIPRSTVEADRLKDLFACIVLLSYPDGQEITGWSAPSDAFRVLSDEQYYYIVANEQQVTGLLEDGKSYCLRIGGAENDEGYWSEPFTAVGCGCLTRIEMGHTAAIGDVPYQTNFHQVFYTREKLCDGQPETITQKQSGTAGDKVTYQRQTKFKRLDLTGLPDYVVDVLTALPIHRSVRVTTPTESFEVLPGRSSVDITGDTCCYSDVTLNLAERQTELRAGVGCETVSATELEEQHTTHPGVCTNAAIWTPADLTIFDQGPSVLPVLPSLPSAPPPVPAAGTVLGETDELTDCQTPFLKDGIAYTVKTTKLLANGAGGAYTAEYFSGPCLQGEEEEIILPEVDPSVVLENIVLRVGQAVDLMLAPTGLFRPVVGQTLTVTASAIPPGTTCANGRLSGNPTQEGDFETKITATLSGGGKAIVRRTITVLPDVPNSQALGGLVVDYDLDTEVARLQVNAARPVEVKAVPLSRQRLNGGNVFIVAEKVNGQTDRYAYDFTGAAPGRYRFHAKSQGEPGEGITFEVLLTRTGTMSQDLQRVSESGNKTTLPLRADRFLSATVDIDETFDYVSGWRELPGGELEPIRFSRSLMGGSTQNGLKPIAPILEDRSVVVGVPFTFIWDEFQHAVSYTVAGLPAGFSVTDVGGRVISGTASVVNSGQEVTITAYGPTGLSTSASFTFRATAPEARNIQTIYQQPNGSGGTRLYLFGEGGTGDIKIRVLSGTTVLVDGLWTKDPGKWDAPGVFTGYAPYTYLIPALPNGNYTVEAQLGSSSQAIEAPMVVNGTTGGRIYPFSFNAYLKRPSMITGGATHLGINDGDLEAEFSITVAPDKNVAILGIIVQNAFPFFLKTESIRIFPATSSPQARQSLAGAYLISAKEGLDQNQTLTQNLNTAGSKNVRLPDSIPDAHAGGDYFDIPWDGQDAAYFILQSENNYLAAKEIEVKGYYPPNPPPRQIKAIEPITVMEGSSGSMGMAQFFSDPGDILSYGGILNGNVALPSWLSVVPYTGKLTWTNVPFEGLLTENQTYYPVNIVVVDTGNNQLLAPLPFYVKRINTLPAEVELLIFHLDAGNMSGTTYARVTEGTWASNLIGVDVDYKQTAHGTATGSYTTADGGYPFNRLGVPYLGLTAGKTYIHELYKPGSNPLVIFRSPVTLIDTTKDYELGRKNTGSEEDISSVFVDSVLLDEEHKILARSRATGPVTLRIVKVGGGYDSGLLTTAIPSGKDYYEAPVTGVVADGTYEVVAALVSNPDRKTSITCVVKTEVKRMTIYPTNVTNGVMYGIGIAARTSPKKLTLQFLKPAITGESWSVEVDTKVDFSLTASFHIRAKITGISGVEPQWRRVMYNPTTNTETPLADWEKFDGLFGGFPEMPSGYTHGDMAWVNQGEDSWVRFYFRIPGYVAETLLLTQDHRPAATGHDWTQRLNRINATTNTPAEPLTMSNNPAEYTGTDDTHRYNYGEAPPYSGYKFDESHIYAFRIGTSGPWTNTKPYARNGDGVGIRRNVWPITGSDEPGTTTSELLDTATVSWILDETYLN